MGVPPSPVSEGSSASLPALLRGLSTAELFALYTGDEGGSQLGFLDSPRLFLEETVLPEDDYAAFAAGRDSRHRPEARIARRPANARGRRSRYDLQSFRHAAARTAKLREELQALPGAPKITFTDVVVRACAVTLLKHPGVNASFTGTAIRRHRAVHMGIAVAVDDGLITPVLRDCDQKSLFQIAAEAKDLIERTRARKLRQPELSGATFSVSNLGMFPVDEFSAIINPPEGAILAVGAIVEKPVVVDGQLAVGKRMRVTLSADHRVLDGAMGARFLADLKAGLEAPLTLLV